MAYGSMISLDLIAISSICIKDHYGKEEMCFTTKMLKHTDNFRSSECEQSGLGNIQQQIGIDR